MNANKRNRISFNFYNCRDVRIYYNTPIRHDRHGRNVQRNEGVKNKIRRHMNTNTQNRISFHCHNMRTYYNTPIPAIPHDRYDRSREVTKKKRNRRCYRCQSEDHLINHCTAPETPRRPSLLPLSSAVSPGPLVRPQSPVLSGPLVRPPSPVLPGPLVRPPSPVLPGPLVRPQSPVLSGPLVRPQSPVLSGPLVRPPSPVLPGPLVRPPSPVLPRPLVRQASSVMPGPRPLVWPSLLVLPSPTKELKGQQQQSGDKVTQLQEVVEVATVPSKSRYCAPAFQVWRQ